jgi:hypothetical protein
MTTTTETASAETPDIAQRAVLPRSAVWRTDQPSEVMLAQWGEGTEHK